MAGDAGRTREINFQGAKGETTIEELPATSAMLVNEIHERVNGVIPVSRVRGLARASSRARSGVSVTAVYRLPNKSLPVKSIPGPSGKRRNDGLLSQNRETLELKVQPDATPSLLPSSLYPGHSTFSPNHFLCTSEKIKTRFPLICQFYFARLWKIWRRKYPRLM